MTRKYYTEQLGQNFMIVIIKLRNKDKGIEGITGRSHTFFAVVLFGSNP
jgi:hypothetical protein